MKRKDFIKLGSGALLSLAFEKECVIKPESPVIISTWADGKQVNAAAWPLLKSGKSGLDAIEKGGNWIEDTINCCVGLGGNPDRDGKVTLDASMMNHDGSIGAVAALERIKYPISVARQVMEKTPHVLLVGHGAQQFALEMGHKLESDTLSESAKKQYDLWLKEKNYQPQINIEKKEIPQRLKDGGFNHDTMAMLAIDAKSKLAGGVTTSGMGFKMRGRVGDSPIIGAGLFVDGEVGAATSSGVGEEVIRVAGSHLVVELMRQGKSPHEACKEAVMRIIRRAPEKAKTLQVGFIALRKDGKYGAYAIQPGFEYAIKTDKEDRIIPAESYFKK